MRICECGAMVPDDASRCSICGAEMQAVKKPAQTSRTYKVPQQVKKCEKCGATITFLARQCPHCGGAIVSSTVMVEKEMKFIGASKEQARTKVSGNGQYHGSLILVGLFLLGVLLGSVCTLGLAAPWLICAYTKYVLGNTYYGGRRIVFTGNGRELFGRFYLWLLLSIVTAGIYTLLFLPYFWEKWKVSHCSFSGIVGQKSEFRCSLKESVRVHLVATFDTLITLGLGSFWAYCYRMRWKYGSTVISGSSLGFSASAWAFFGWSMLWELFSELTLRIYGLFVPGKQYEWITAHSYAMRAE